MNKQVQSPSDDYFWIHGLEEYLTHINHHQLEVFLNIKKAILHGNIWKIKRLILAEISRGKIQFSEEFLNILMANFIGWDYVNNRTMIRYISHCIDDPYIKKISKWCIRWETEALLNDHFSRGQICSKMWMVDKLLELFPDKNLGTVAHYGGWYATIAHIMFENFKIPHYFNLELDPHCVEMADNFNIEHLMQGWQYKTAQVDCGNIMYDHDGKFEVEVFNRAGESVPITIKPKIVINTSCEHMDEDWFNNLPTRQLVCLQTNDYFSNEQHINCCKNLEQVKQKYPMSNIYYAGELDTQLYNRFMLIGEI